MNTIVAVLAVALSVFWLVRISQEFIDAPPWFWRIVQIAAAIGGTVLWMPDDKWYVAFASLGVVEFVEQGFNLLTVKGDELVGRITRRR